MPKVSIILPVYNAESTVAKTIESVQNQTFEDWELIIIDDGSKDNSGKICDDYASLNNRIHVHHIQNGGPSNARNYALDKCSGKYIMFIDADDIYISNIIEMMFKAIEESNMDLICCNYIKLQGEKETPIKNVNELFQSDETQLYKIIEYMQEKFLYNVVWNKIYKTEIIKNHDIKFDKSINMGEDYRFNNVYFKYVKSIKVLKDALYIHIIDTNTISAKYRENEFERRIGNIITNEELYIKHNYPMKRIHKKYIEAVIGSIEVIMSKKSNLTIQQQLNRTKQYVEHPKILETAKNDKENNNIYIWLIKNKYYKMLYLCVWLRTQIKKLVYSLKKNKYRR